MYQITPHSTTGDALSELLTGQRFRSRLDRLFPDVNKKIESRQEKQKAHNKNQPL